MKNGSEQSLVPTDRRAVTVYYDNRAVLESLRGLGSGVLEIISVNPSFGRATGFGVPSILEQIDGVSIVLWKDAVAHEEPIG